MEKIILVDEDDNEIGLGEKLDVHKKGLLHRAFSIFVFNSKGELLLQRRERSKYHCGGLWTNTCCSHPREGESVLEAAHRRLMEEMGFDCDLKEFFSFKYKSVFDNGLTEHEFDHVLVGHFDGEPVLNIKEADAFKLVSLDFLKKDVKSNPEKYTPWFMMCFEKAFSYA